MATMDELKKRGLRVFYCGCIGGIIEAGLTVILISLYSNARESGMSGTLLYGPLVLSICTTICALAQFGIALKIRYLLRKNKLI